MELFIEYVARKLAARPDDVQVAARESHNALEYELSVHPSDLGRIIGHHGRTIGAIRALLHAAASRHSKRAILNVMEDDGGGGRRVHMESRPSKGPHGEPLPDHPESSHAVEAQENAPPATCPTADLPDDQPPDHPQPSP